MPRVFVSGVYADVNEQRAAVLELAPRHGWEVTDLAQFENTAQAINASDVFLLIAGATYGDVQLPDYGAINLRGVVSAVEAEFRYAAIRKKPILAFVRREIERDAIQVAFLRQVKSRLRKFEEFTFNSDFRQRLRELLEADGLRSAAGTVSLPCFVSYCHADRDVVRPIVEEVDDALPIYVDYQQLQAGDVLDTRLLEAIAKAGFVLAFLSAAAVVSPWVQKELNCAREQERARGASLILPVLLDDFRPAFRDTPEKAAPLAWLPAYADEHFCVSVGADGDEAVRLLIETARNRYAELLWKD